MPHPTITALRSLVDARFPVQARKPCGVVSTGIPAVDWALSGGLPIGRITELVSAEAGSGGQLVLTQLLGATRAAGQRVALVDGADGFAPESVPEDALRHVVWVRPASLTEALAATDVLVRDGNYAVVAVDLRGMDEKALLRTPKTQWHRLQRATESQPAAVLILTTVGLVPAVPNRLILTGKPGIASRRRPKTELLAQLRVEVARGRVEFPAEEALAG